jgi:hypothetical protein
MPDDEDEALKIVRLELTPQSMKSWRDLNERHPIFYPVLVRLSRPLDDYERYAIKKFEPNTFVVAQNDPHLLLMSDETTLEVVRERIPDLTERINRAVRLGQEPRQAAMDEDSRLLNLEQEINDELSGDGS